MKLLLLSQCENYLCLPKKSTWRAPLPVLAVNGLVVTPITGQSSGIVVNLSENLASTLHALYPSASWYELLQLKDSGRFDEDAWTFFLGLYGMRWNDDLKKTLPLRFSGSLENVLSEKDLRPREMAPLLLVPEALRSEVLEWIFSTTATRSQISRLIELLSEIVAMSDNAAERLRALKNATNSTTQNPDLWVRNLEALRFPHTFRRDKESAENLKNLDLPLRVKADHKRQGDETRVELKISAKTPTEMKRLLADLTSKPWENAWKSH